MVAVFRSIGGEGAGVAEYRHSAEPERARAEGWPAAVPLALWVAAMMISREFAQVLACWFLAAVIPAGLCLWLFISVQRHSMKVRYRRRSLAALFRKS